MGAAIRPAETYTASKNYWDSELMSNASDTFSEEVARIQNRRQNTMQNYLPLFVHSCGEVCVY